MLSYATLLLTAAIWGFAFVAQRKGLESLDPFTFNFLRFTLGAFCVWLFRVVAAKREKSPEDNAVVRYDSVGLREPVVLGVLLFIAASLQQCGMIWTGAGSAGFITGLYIVFVPLIGLFRKQRLRRNIVLAIVLSLAGMWLMNQGAELDATLGNLIVLVGAFFWALHVQMIDRLTRHYHSLDLALTQFSVCAVLSFLGSIIYRIVIPGQVLFDLQFVSSIYSALLPILYAGVLSVGVAFTLQLYAQKRVHPQAASVILCLEGVFAMLGGFLLLHESISLLSLIGAVLLFAAMVVSVVSDRGKIFLIDKKGASQI